MLATAAVPTATDPTTPTPRGGARPALDDDGSIAPGTVIGGEYEVVRELARGGMGALYVARHRGSDQLRALKTMHARYVTDPTMRARFAREARVSAQVASDHAVEVYGAGVDDALLVPWMAMELLDGEDLARRVERLGAMAPAEVAAVMGPLGHCLAAAHRAGIVHRDLKAANVFLAASRRPGEPFAVKVLDFGIAKFLHLATLSATTSAIGSPLWMSPEQTNPEAPISPATDVWSVGLLAFFLLTGRVYWITPTQPEANLAALLGELLMLPLPSASARAATLGADGRIPPGFDAWFARCLARDPAARFPDAASAVPPLVALLHHAAPTTAPSPPARPTPDAARRLGASQLLPTPGAMRPTLVGPAAARPARSRLATVGLVGASAALTVALAAAVLWALPTRADPPRPATVTATAPRPTPAAAAVARPAPAPNAAPPATPTPAVATPTATPPDEVAARPRRASARPAATADRADPTPAVFALPALAAPPDPEAERRWRRRRRGPFEVLRGLPGASP